ncbi:MAG TPA: hypothetical protein VFX41_07060 [Actinomycetales bacterium]|nr:hypothetical protein [Actinomycetales bacterium]
MSQSPPDVVGLTPGGGWESRLGRALQILLGLLLIATVAGVLISPLNGVFDFPTGPVVASFVVVLALSGVAAALRRTRWARTVSRRGGWPVALPFAVVSSGAAVWVAQHLQYAFAWDARTLWRFAGQLERGDHTAYLAYYLSRYPNNVAMLAVDRLTIKVAHGLDVTGYTVAIWVNGIFLVTTLVLVFVTVRMLAGVLPALIAQVVTFLLAGLSPWMAVPYTDMAAMPFVAGTAALAVAGLRAVQKDRSGRGLALLAGAAVVGAAGAVLRTTPTVLIIALGLVLLLTLLHRPTRSRRVEMRTALAGILVVSLLFAGSTALGRALTTGWLAPTTLNLQRTPPPQWWMAMGLKTVESASGHTWYGGFDGVMVRESTYMQGDALKLYSTRELRKQLDAMGPSGVAVFEAQKQRFNWGDGMFFAWGEDGDAKPGRFLDEDPASLQVQAWQHPTGTYYPVRGAAAQGLWSGVLLWLGVGLLIGPYSRGRAFLTLSILGITAFVLLFQGRSRYLFSFVPLVVTLAATVDPVYAARELVTRFSRRRRPRPLDPEQQLPADDSPSHAAPVP